MIRIFAHIWRTIARWYPLGLVMLALGCTASMSTGSQNLTSQNVSKIIKGTTTRDEVVSMLGPPDSIFLMSDGRRMMTYLALQSHSDQTNLMTQMIVPFAVFVPGTNTSTSRTQQLQIYLSKNNVVEDYEFSDNTSQMNVTSSAFGATAQQITTPTTEPVK